MTPQPLRAARFVRKTRLEPGEYRKNFHQIDRETISVVTSAEADALTPLMSKIYLRLVNAPECYWEREGVLRFEAEFREGGSLKAWAVLCELLGVASATASKALRWMHEQGVIGYFAGKNGAGIRIFLNRAASSIGTRVQATSQKILDFPRGSFAESPGSRNEAASKAPYGVLESSDKDFNPHAPKNGADTNNSVEKVLSRPSTSVGAARQERPREVVASGQSSLDEVVSRLRREIEPELLNTARRAAVREQERTREWLESKGLPKAARVAQRETYNVLRQQGLVGVAERRARAELGLGRQVQEASPEEKALMPEEVMELAEACVAMFEAHGQSIETTLTGLSAEAGGCLSRIDLQKVRELAEEVARGGPAG